MLLTLKIAHNMRSITVFLQPAFLFIAASRFLTNLPKTSLSALVRMVWPQTTGNLTNSGLNYQISTAYLTRYLGVSRPRIDSTAQERLKDPDVLSLPTSPSSVCERSFLMGPALLLKLEAPPSFPTQRNSHREITKRNRMQMEIEKWLSPYIPFSLNVLFSVST